MEIDSLAWRTDLALLTASGSEVEDRGDHLVVRTPDNPHYYWGNFLLLDSPPGPEEGPEWVRRFRGEFPVARHLTFGVNGTAGSVEDLAPFAAAGLGVEAMCVMTTRSVHPPPRPNQDAECRSLVTDADWEQQVDLTVVGEGHRDRTFATRRTAAVRALVEQGRGRWFGAFRDGRLVSSLGLFVASEGLARFQEVKTHPDARGQGLCGTLVHHAGRYGFDEMGVHTLVMVADPGYLAIRVYRSVGFSDTEVQLQAERPPDREG